MRNTDEAVASARETAVIFGCTFYFQWWLYMLNIKFLQHACSPNKFNPNCQWTREKSSSQFLLQTRVFYILSTCSKLNIFIFQFCNLPFQPSWYKKLLCSLLRWMNVSGGKKGLYCAYQLRSGILFTIARKPPTFRVTTITVFDTGGGVLLHLNPLSFFLP